MGTEIASGLCATRSAGPDMTFVWDVTENAGNLKVRVCYGGGTDIGNVGTATIEAGSTAPVDVVPANNDQITVKGQVQAYWSDNQETYVVTFSGQMVRPTVNNMFSSNINGVPQEDYQIIVYAYLN